MFSTQKINFPKMSDTCYMVLLRKTAGIRKIRKMLNGGGWITNSLYPQEFIKAREYLSMNLY